MKKLTLEEVVEKADQLPELPQVALRVSRMLGDPNVSAQQLSDLIRLDPNLTGQVLRLCNSAAYGFARKIATAREAIAILGFNTLKSLIYTIISHTALNRPVKGYALDSGALWHNALTCAVYAKYLAEKQGFKDPELAFTGALLRDIGKIILGEYVGANYIHIEALTQKEQIDFVEAEERVIGLSHTTVGMKVAEKWSLPENLAYVIGYHHKPSAMPEALKAEYLQLVTLVHLADIFTLIIGTGVGSDGMMYCLDTEAIADIGINLEENELEALLADLIDKNQAVQSLSSAF